MYKLLFIKKYSKFWIKDIILFEEKRQGYFELNRENKNLIIIESKLYYKLLTRKYCSDVVLLYIIYNDILKTIKNKDSGEYLFISNVINNKTNT